MSFKANSPQLINANDPKSLHRKVSLLVLLANVANRFPVGDSSVDTENKSRNAKTHRPHYALKEK